MAATELQMDKERQPHFSMIRGFHLADWFTIANAFCGMGAVLAVMAYLKAELPNGLLVAAALVPVAFVFDVFDGRIARWRQKNSALGRELDSLADVISFGVAPAALGFAAGLQGGLDAVVLVGVLAYAAWQGHIGSALWGGAWVIGPWQLHPLTLLFALSGTLMISKTLRIPKF